MKILFPSDFFKIKQIDVDYSEEYNTSKQLNFEPILFNYDEFINDKKLKLYPHELSEGLCIYRGWMLKPEQYLELYNQLKQKNIILINSPTEYNKFHLFPNVYNDLKNFTPETIWYENIEEIDWNLVSKIFKRFIIKDFVKSVKGTSFPKFFSSEINILEMNEYIKKFIELRGSLYTGGIVIKEYVDLKFYGDVTNEYRAFYLNENIVSVSRNSNQPNNCPFISLEFVNKFCSLGSFYTIDFAELNNGEWIIIETGDGQVSGLSPNQYIFEFYQKINNILKEC